jgi:cell division protein FtsL
MSEELKELSLALFQYGGTVVMAVLFIIYLHNDRKDRKEKELEEKEDKKQEREANNAILKELSVSNRNIAESLNLLKTSMDNTNNEFKQHDERAIKSFQNIHEDLLILKERK